MTFMVTLNIVFIAVISYLLFLNSSHTITETERINIKNKEGANRVVISNEENIPNPIIMGKEYNRKVQPAGLIFYDKKGDERGGIAISEIDNLNINALAFDYQNADAIGMVALDNLLTDYYKAGIIINDKDISGKPGHNTNRIELATENGNAALVIKDANEIPRIVLKVDSLGDATIEMFDHNGKSKWKN